MFVGISEAVLSCGGFIMPLLGGAMASKFSELRAPYWVAIGIVSITMIAQELVSLKY